MDFNTLCAAKGVPGSIADILNNSQISGSIPYFVQEAESIIYRRLRHWRMLTPPTSGTMVVGEDTIALPSDFLEGYNFYITSSASVSGYGPMMVQMATPEQVIAHYSYDGNGTRVNMTPTLYYVNGSYLQLNFPADLAYPYSLIYYAQPAALSITNTTNWLTSFYPRMLRSAIMAQATEWTKELATGQYDRTYWFSITEAEIEKAQQESDMARRSASSSSAMIAY